jgi:signal peptidase I
LWFRGKSINIEAVAMLQANWRMHRKSRTYARLRPVVELAVLLLMAAAALRTWFLEGFPVGCQVSGGSMAETLLGRHRDVVCADCGQRFPCNAEGDLAARRVICPNCGYPGNRADETGVLPGDRVLIDHTTFLFRPPRRWEVVAFRRPDEAHALYVKRVVGLPNESIQIRHGDVYADGQLQRKTLAQQRAMAILVHDASQQPRLKPPPPPRWKAESRHSAWKTETSAFIHASTPGEQVMDWLVYHHGHRRGDRPDEVTPAPVTDVCGYDPGRLRRDEDIHPVTDLMLSLRVAKISGPGSLVLWATDGWTKFRVEVDPAGGCYRVLQDGRPLSHAAGKLFFPREGLKIEVSLFDQQFLLGLGGQTVVQHPYDRPDRPPTPSVEPLAIGAKRVEVVLDEVRVYRDVYYTQPAWSRRGRGTDGAVQLGRGEYFVLGDNSPISDDSRTWTPAAVNDACLLGKPFAVILPVRYVVWGSWHIQVPDLARIRYIR